MQPDQTYITVKGRRIEVPCLAFEGFRIVTTGRFLKRASVEDEQYCERDPAKHAPEILQAIQEQKFNADVFCFAQRLPDLTPRFSFPMVWDNAAAIAITSYAKWLESLSQETRRNVRMAAKRGLDVRQTAFDDDFVRGIMEINNENVIRDGRKFWHYGAPFETVKASNGTYAEASEFIGAYHGSELAGYLKLVYVGEFATIMQILCKKQHQDKRPMNALIAKAVEVCAQRGKSHLLYCKYTYHKNAITPLTEFKRRNGFESIPIPRYYVPLTVKGRLALRTRLQDGVKELLPESLTRQLLQWRRRYYDFAGRKMERGV